jgi:hypothetical protein
VRAARPGRLHTACGYGGALRSETSTRKNTSSARHRQRGGESAGQTDAAAGCSPAHSAGRMGRTAAIGCAIADGFSSFTSSSSKSTRRHEPSEDEEGMAKNRFFFSESQQHCASTKPLREKEHL